MLTTNDYYLPAEIAYRRERIAQDWAAANLRHRSARGRHRSLRLLRRSTGRVTKQRPGGATLA